MFDQLQVSHPRSRPRWIVWSAMIHGGLIVALLWSGPTVRVRKFLPGTSKGTKIELSYLPGGAAATTAKADRRKPKVEPAKQTPVKAPEPELARAAPLAPAPEPASTKSADVDASSSGGAGTSSNDALGTDNIQIALTTYSPSPKPDLSRMPRGTQGEVVLDVTIDPTGRVADLQILHALGYGVEEPVVETVRTWTFRPATKDGVPVASVQELHFHFGPV